MDFMIRYHPHQNVYFNFLASRQAEYDFELDYWGNSYKQALEFLLKFQAEGPVRLNVENFSGEINQMAIDPKKRERLRYTSLQEADYFIFNHRFMGPHGRFLKKEYPYSAPEIFSIAVQDSTIVRVYKLK